MPMVKPKPILQQPLVVAPPVRLTPESDFSGQRRLVRPSLSMRAVAGRQTALYGNGPALTARSVTSSGPREDSSHAEVFYFQKQIQAQTRMIVVLENGEQFEGVIEWYDRYAIKMRNVGHNGRNRMLVYKDSIRYIYKAGENAPQTMS
jgi:sRNA-binding regulator protein Hfq